MKKWYPNDQKVKRFIDQMYRKYPHGFYVNAEQRMKDAKGAAKYIGRYLARPAICPECNGTLKMKKEEAKD